jgi:crotonobetainyl-CoA:carnitine CoA-transferase CaiB-like acyl-CoA transferase
MLDGMISTMTSNYMSYLGSGDIPRPMGTSFPTVVPYRVFQTQHTAVAIPVGSEKLWSAFCRVMECPQLTAHPDYATNGDRIRNCHALEPLLEDAFRERPTGEWIERLRRAHFERPY